MFKIPNQSNLNFFLGWGATTEYKRLKAETHNISFLRVKSSLQYSLYPALFREGLW
ncbi:hypothetical protein THF1C08_320040 [Vibrio jasicida]|nr:hypothetical protein THF1C08_320040 [Vibrio jasicida]